MKNYNWKQFHDSAIGLFLIDWDKGILKINLSLKGDYEMEIIGFTHVSISRNFPWGKSQFINNIKYEKNELRNWQLEIELQSGDHIIIEGGLLNIRQ